MCDEAASVERFFIGTSFTAFTEELNLST
jgi:hypothetical protein